MTDEMVKEIVSGQFDIITRIAEIWKEAGLGRNTDVYNLYCKYMYNTIKTNSFVEGNQINEALLSRLNNGITDIDVLDMHRESRESKDVIDTIRDFYDISARMIDVYTKGNSKQ